MIRLRWLQIGSAVLIGLLALLLAPDAHAAATGPGLSISLGGNDTALTERVLQMIALLTVLSLAPSKCKV